MVRKARAVWRGTGKDGNGDLTTDSGVLSSTPYSFKTRFESEPGTNPEELIAAAHAGCFTMALAFQLQGAGFTPTELATEAAVSLEKEGDGFKISKSALTLRAQGICCKVGGGLRKRRGWVQIRLRSRTGSRRRWPEPACHPRQCSEPAPF
jgi:lipoyl-dependent peroxiredoxin